MMGWLFLFFAALFEIGWVYSLRFLELKKIKNTPFWLFFENTSAIQLLFPLMGYIGFGLANIFFFSKAMKHISASAAFAVWMALTLIGLKAIDILLLEDQFSWKTMFCILLILFGIAGLKWK
jgi:quaternary ammonium compound-resistance protein SugE